MAPSCSRRPTPAATATCGCWTSSACGRWTSARLGKVAHQREAGEQRGDRYAYRYADIKRCHGDLPALVKQRDVEREGGKCREAAENAGGQEQPPVLAGIAL